MVVNVLTLQDCLCSLTMAPLPTVQSPNDQPSLLVALAFQQRRPATSSKARRSSVVPWLVQSRYIAATEGMKLTWLSLSTLRVVFTGHWAESPSESGKSREGGHGLSRLYELTLQWKPGRKDNSRLVSNRKYNRAMVRFFSSRDLSTPSTSADVGLALNCAARETPSSLQIIYLSLLQPS